MHLIVILFPRPQNLKNNSLPPVLAPGKSSLKTVVAEYNYEPKENSDIQLVRNSKYYVLKEENPDWWQVRDMQG